MGEPSRSICKMPVLALKVGSCRDSRRDQTAACRAARCRAPLKVWPSAGLSRLAFRAPRLAARASARAGSTCSTHPKLWVLLRNKLLSCSISSPPCSVWPTHQLLTLPGQQNQGPAPSAQPGRHQPAVSAGTPSAGHQAHAAAGLVHATREQRAPCQTRASALMSWRGCSAAWQMQGRSSPCCEAFRACSCSSWLHVCCEL